MPLDKTKNTAPLCVPGHPFRSLLRYNLRYGRRYAVGAMLAVVFVVIGLAMPLVVRSLIGHFEAFVKGTEGGMTAGILWLYFGGLMLAASVTGIARYFERMLMIGASRHFEYDLRNDFYAQIQCLSQRFFHRNQTGDLMARATNDLNYVRDFIGPGVMGTVDMIRLPFTLATMIYLSGHLTLLALMPLPALTILVYFFMRYMNRQSKKVQELFSGVTARVQENLAGARVVKAYGVADREERIFRADSVVYMRENLRLALVMAMAWPMIGAVLGVAVLIIVWQGGRMVIEGAMPLGDLTAFLICLVMLAWPLVQFGWVLTLYQRGATGMNRLSEILAETPDIADSDATDPAARIAAGGIRFEGVTFGFGGEPVLRGIDLDIAAGETLGLAGRTGTGKTTLLALLTREYDPDAGRILIDGHDLRTIPLETLRAGFGCVPQDTFVFSDSILENVRFGRADASREAVHDACEIAQFNEAVAEFPAGLDTLLGERGVNLSGGQKQRLALARALVRDPKILVLDDALSSVDTHTEERILERIETILAQRTCVIVSHRVSTLRHADRIAVLEDGRIAELGTHAELLALDGAYARLYRRQLLEQALDADEGEARHE